MTEITVFRVVQESLTNVQKHAAASQVDVSLSFNQGGLSLQIKDNGQGFEPNEEVAGREDQGMGLLSMQERAELLGGTLLVHSGADVGCEVVMDVPPKEVVIGAHPSPSSG